MPGGGFINETRPCLAQRPRLRGVVMPAPAKIHAAQDDQRGGGEHHGAGFGDWTERMLVIGNGGSVRQFNTVNRESVYGAIVKTRDEMVNFGIPCAAEEIGMIASIETVM